jgi:hypothetical protein
MTEMTEIHGLASFANSAQRVVGIGAEVKPDVKDQNSRKVQEPTIAPPFA